MDSSITVLVVDDSDDVRMSCVRVLSNAGYCVLDCSNGFDALAIISETPRVALVLSDIEMPGMSGIALAESLRFVRPRLPVILMSGKSWQEVGGESDVVGSNTERAGAFISKPCSATSLRGVVAAELERATRY